jgi:hypothetical protein
MGTGAVTGIAVSVIIAGVLAIGALVVLFRRRTGPGSRSPEHALEEEVNTWSSFTEDASGFVSEGRGANSE